ncbi:cobyric acid synthase [Longimicrobium sp.]|uniref:cobyric acid synthase n=1 Tax=Longimicrobium sp. TaxID=2029185 RepID=UPI002E315C95|nr:cobyric acid synthase [Longimicrobium sp.]HEX6037563.1 cobyric acid synthase [Longimicrobium sp.]
MVQGTASGVGKSFLTAALCRVFARRGVRVLPFKAQNMSNNAAVTADGGEMGRAQALQARAAGVAPDVRMNPVLLKPVADTRSDVVLMGRSRPELSALHWHARRERLWPAVTDALAELRADADLVIAEGAGSPAETNLRATDIVNMAVARHADAAVLLAADIDRGGAFASLYGTWALLDEADRGLIRGFVLNRFRGDARLLAPAPADLEARTGVPTVGVVPYTRHRLPEEDAFGLEAGGGEGLPIAAIRLPHLANFDDLDPLAAEPGVSVRWVDRPQGIEGAAAIVIPGTRNTLADLRWLWESGLAAAIRARAAAGTPVVGLCGGYQVLGARVADPHGIEDGGECAGLGLLAGSTVLERGKTTRVRADAVVAAHGPFSALAGSALGGYEIHHGRTTLGDGDQAWIAAGGEALGAAAGTAWGTYLHSVFGNDGLRRAWLQTLRAGGSVEGWEARVEREIDRVADHVEENMDMPRIAAMIGREHLWS